MSFALAALLVAAADPDPAFAVAAALGRGINLGNALEAPLREGQWGVTIRPDYITKIKAAGFGHVRLPVRWSAHAWPEADYAINPKFFARVDQILDQAQAAGLKVVLNMHHFDDLYADPATETERFLSLWWQIAERYKDRPDSVLFEPLNEPHDKLSADLWNDLFPKVLGTIRGSNPTRMVVVGGANYSNLWELKNLSLPADDRRLIPTFHYYEPFKFTHQGAPWQQGADVWLGTKWAGTADERKKLADDFAVADAWAKENRRPLYVGEFGAFDKADMASRAAWTGAVRAEAERLGMPWAYWEFASSFGCFDPIAHRWKKPLLEALVPPGK